MVALISNKDNIEAISLLLTVYVYLVTSHLLQYPCGSMCLSVPNTHVSEEKTSSSEIQQNTIHIQNDYNRSLNGSINNAPLIFIEYRKESGLTTQSTNKPTESYPMTTLSPRIHKVSPSLFHFSK